MPTTNPKQKKKNNQNTNNKRLQVTDSSGWTHVTTATRARRLPKKTNPTNPTPARDADTNPKTEEKETLQPSEPPKNLTLESLNAQFQRHYERWQASESWGVVRGAIRSLAPNPATTQPTTDTDTDTDTDTNTDAATRTAQIQNIISIGLGSPSGFLRGGWVDRRQVSMDQLAALVSIQKLLGNVTVYAQDPVFNPLDESLFHSLDITVIQHPSAFERVSSSSFLYCPGVERVHLDALLGGANPRALFGGPLEEMESDVVNVFLDGKSGTKVPVFEGDEKAFWGMRVYL